ncbi:MAG: citrate lyase acyl carrier protein [Veillonella sp.]|nr:citrate lyase acyl carrier protein [Veillonella sp.]
MAQLVKAAQAGFDEKNDALVTVEPIASGIEIELTSKVIRQYYGDQIKSVILNTVKEAGYDGVKVIVQDKNAWDYTIKARVLGALERGSKA